MGFIKLTKPGNGAQVTPPDGVAVSTRQLNAKRKKGQPDALTRFAVIRIGARLARKAGMTAAKHRCQLLIGDENDRLRCGVTVDDKAGPFKLNRRENGEYQTTVGSAAAGAFLNFDAPRFTAPAELVAVAVGGPQCVMFDLTEEFRQ